MNNRELLAITRRPVHLVSRRAEINKIHRAIFDEGSECRLVLVEGAGGLGKTRLVEEVMRRLGNEEAQKMYDPPRTDKNNWNKQDNVQVSDLIDFTDVRLHSREYFIEKLADHQNWAGNLRFTKYAQAHARYQRMADHGAAFTMLQPAAVEEEKAFWEDYQQNTKNKRLVIPMDTTEQLAIISSGWMIKHGLIRPEDTTFNTQQWLVDQIEKGNFCNTTLIIAGRGEEGSEFFKLLKKAATPRCQLIQIELKPFSLEETASYFETIYEDWREVLKEKPAQSSTAVTIQEVLDTLIADEAQRQLFWLYTGGQPIRLALYLDVLVEGKSIPEPLFDSVEKAQRIAADENALKAVQKSIEADFVQLLFSAENDLRAHILRALARTTRGLNAEQIHFVLDSARDQSARNWTPDAKRLDQIESELDAIRTLSIVKQKPNNRVGLQDEMYRIYAECMSANDGDRKKEIVARESTYNQLQEWAAERRRLFDEEDEKFVEEDIKRIRVERPSAILNSQMPKNSDMQARRRNQTAVAQVEATLEYLHYTLLQDPNVHFNDIYYNMANERRSAYQEEHIAMLQAEMWRILHDDNTFRFIDFNKASRSPDSLTKDTRVVLHQAAEIDDAVKWIIRFILQMEYDRAIHIANEIDRVAQTLTNEGEHHSWNHTLARGERACWRQLARIYKGDDLEDCMAMLEGTANELEILAKKDINTWAFEDRKERGFIGHPAERRLQLILSIAFSTLGYACTTLGEFQKAVQFYTRSLQYIRQLPKNQAKSEEATVRNNLARALVEMDKKRAVRLCEDGLELRKNVGDWLPIALSFNTLGLIMNDLYRPLEAVQFCARAYAIATHVGDPRTIGLSLTQLGEALRRLLGSNVPSQDDPEEIYREAEKALQQAQDIFTTMNEKVRLIEVHLELGCLYRNWMFNTKLAEFPHLYKRRYDDAIDHLSWAIKESNKANLVRLELDARVNLSWAYFYAKEPTKAKQALQMALDLIYENAHESALLKANQPVNNQDRVSSYFYKQLSKMYNLYGTLALTEFKEIDAQLKERLYTRNDDLSLRKQKNEALRKAADAYVQALGYAEIFAPRSHFITIIYDVLYDSLKRMNQDELKVFYQAEKEATARYNIHQIEVEKFGVLEDFLRDNFGDYYN